MEAVFLGFITCEFSTLARDGTPITWPTMPAYWPARNQFVILASAGLAQKAVNARRNPRVALLFSDATGSGLHDPPSVLVQGDAEAPDRLLTDLDDLDPEFVTAATARMRLLLERQPSMRLYLANPLTRRIMDWYFVRLMITVTPRRILWWPGGDFDSVPEVWEAAHVG